VSETQEEACEGGGEAGQGSGAWRGGEVPQRANGWSGDGGGQTATAGGGLVATAALSFRRSQGVSSG